MPLEVTKLEITDPVDEVDNYNIYIYIYISLESLKKKVGYA